MITKQLLPREKIYVQGVNTLSDQELMQVILGSGVKGMPVDKLAVKVNDLMYQLLSSDDLLTKLLGQRGISKAKACLLIAVMEYARRWLLPASRINSLSDLLPFIEEYRHRHQEHLFMFCLDGAGRITSRHLLTIGTLNQTLIHPREVFALAIEKRAASIILVHNHPSGNARPSIEDIAVTKNIVEAGKLMGIKLQDHVIVTSAAECSLKESGYL